MTPGDADYDASREIWNRLYDRRPRAIVRCESASDVVAAVRFAREYDLEIAVKGGGHHAAGYSSIDDGILLNLGSMRTVTVSPAQQRAVAQTGLTWAQFDQVNQAFGLACTGPIVSMTCIAGFTLVAASAGYTESLGSVAITCARQKWSRRMVRWLPRTTPYIPIYSRRCGEADGTSV
jgi:FAD/FMN-containing dehydrogenase